MCEYEGLTEKSIMTYEADIIKGIAGQLNDAGIPYMFTGSIAANFYTVPRMTRDIDIVVELKEADIDRVYNLFEKDFYIDKEMILDAIKKGGMFNIIHYQSVFKVDFIIRKGNPYRVEEFKRRKRITFEDTELYITAAEDLILSKLYWAKESMSELQLNDVKNLLKYVKGLDEGYLRQWANYLGVEEIYKKIKA